MFSEAVSEAIGITGSMSEFDRNRKESSLVFETQSSDNGAIYVRNTFIGRKPATSAFQLQKSQTMPEDKLVWDAILNEARKARIRILSNDSSELSVTELNEGLYEKEDLEISDTLSTNEKLGESHKIPISLEDFVNKQGNYLQVPPNSFKSSESSQNLNSYGSWCSVSDISEFIAPVSEEGGSSKFALHSSGKGKAMLEYVPASIDLRQKPLRLHSANSPILAPPKVTVNVFSDNESQSKETAESFCEQATTSSEILTAQTANNAIDEADFTEEIIAKIPRDENGNLLSVGSINHASGDCRGCVFFHHSSKTCLNGIRCLFCHYAHPPKKRVRVSKSRMKSSASAMVLQINGGGTPQEQAVQSLNLALPSEEKESGAPSYTPYRNIASDTISQSHGSSYSANSNARSLHPPIPTLGSYSPYAPVPPNSGRGILNVDPNSVTLIDNITENSAQYPLQPNTRYFSLLPTNYTQQIKPTPRAASPKAEKSRSTFLKPIPMLSSAPPVDPMHLSPRSQQFSIMGQLVPQWPTFKDTRENADRASQHH